MNTTQHIIVESTDAQALKSLGIRFFQNSPRVSEHIGMTIFEVTLPQGQSGVGLIHRFHNPQPHIGFNFCLSGATSFALTGGYPTAHADHRKVNTFMMPACDVTQGLTPQPDLALLTLYVDLPAFINIVGESLEALPLRMLDSMDNGNHCYFESYPWQAITRTVLSQILHAQMSPMAQRIFLESKALELIAIILDIYARGNTKQFGFSRRDMEKIQYARELLLKDLANPPSLSQLARQAGTNEYTLKKGFRELFDVPVFRYLQQMRLAKAYELFQATDLQVSEIALIVGYESVSSFIRAFVQFYGIKPTDVKRIPFRTI